MENQTTKKLSASKIAELVGGRLEGSQDVQVDGVNSLKDAFPSHVSFLGNKKYKSQLDSSKAGVVIVGKDHDGRPRDGQALIFCDNPDIAFSKAIAVFAPPPPQYTPGVHPTAFVHETAVIGEGASIGPNAVVEAGASIGPKTVIGGCAYIGHDAKIGSDSLIYPNVTVRERCEIGSRVIIHSGTTIGSDGFGFVPGPTGIVKLPQTGIVRIDDDVEIGANCAVDRARFGKTWLKRGVKVDNLVQIAHNVVVGEFSILVGQCGIAGSTEIGRGAIIAAQAGINGHITIGDGAKVAGTAGVVKSVPPGQDVVGTPAESPREFMERLALPKKVRKLNDKIADLEAKIEALQLKLK